MSDTDDRNKIQPESAAMESQADTAEGSSELEAQSQTAARSEQQAQQADVAKKPAAKKPAAAKTTAAKKPAAKTTAAKTTAAKTTAAKKPAAKKPAAAKTTAAAKKPAAKTTAAKTTAAKKPAAAKTTAAKKPAAATAASADADATAMPASAAVAAGANSVEEPTAASVGATSSQAEIPAGAAAPTEAVEATAAPTGTTGSPADAVTSEAATAPTEPATAAAMPDQTAIVVAKKKKSHKGLIIGIIVAVVVVAIALFLALGGYDMIVGVNESQIQQDLSHDQTITAGFTSQDYVDQSAYTVSDVKIASHSSDFAARTEDVTCTAMVSNDFFATQVTLRMHYYKDANNAWAYEIQDSFVQSRATRAISQDPDHDLTGATSTFDEAAQICTESVPVSQSEWFKTTSGAHVYDYAFDGTTWRYIDETDELTTAYTIAGTYEPVKITTGTSFKLTISDVDDAAGTFTVNWEYESALSGAAAALGAQSSATGSCPAKISAKEVRASNYEAGDGLSYSFAANSADGATFIAGNFMPSTDGSSTISITTFNASYSNSNGVSSTAVFTGLVKMAS